MAEPFSVALLATPRAYAGGEAAFVFEGDAGTVRSAVVMRPATALDDHIDVRYCVPDDVARSFGPATAAFYAFSRVGIDEAVAASAVHPASEFGTPPAADGSLPAGTVVVFLRPALFRVSLAVLAEAVPADPDSHARFATRMLEPDRTGLRLEEAAVAGSSERARFMPVAAFAASLEASFDPSRKNVYFAPGSAAGG